VTRSLLAFAASAGCVYPLGEALSSHSLTALPLAALVFGGVAYLTYPAASGAPPRQAETPSRPVDAGAVRGERL
jgi:hypothetical protein